MLHNGPVAPLERRIRAWTAFFIVALVISGATALPIPTQVRLAESVLGPDLRAQQSVPEPAASWFRTVRDGVFAAERDAPFLFYGTDWLAFGHFAIALSFLGAYRDPVRNIWLYQFGMIACASVPLWALFFGHIRAIPLWWRAVDASFGVFGFIPLWLCYGWARELERQRHPEGNGPLRHRS